MRGVGSCVGVFVGVVVTWCVGVTGCVVAAFQGLHGLLRLPDTERTRCQILASLVDKGHVSVVTKAIFLL